MSGRERRLDAMEGRVNKLHVPQRLEERFGRYRANPVAFCSDVLGVASATQRSTGAPYQFDVLADLVHEPRVAVRSGHGIGKSAIDAWAALWWLVTRPYARVVVLAPEFSRQIRAVLFSEARKWARRSKLKLPVQVLANRILVEGHGEEWSATGMSTGGDPNRLEGFHAEGGVLLIIDECKGIPQDAFDAVQGALSGLEDSRLLVTSVPGGAGSGPFWKACVSDGRRWKIHPVPATDSSLVSPEWCEDRATDWGKGSPLYETRVRGEFAEAGEGVLFPLPLIEAAMARELPVATGGQLGVDVARSTDGDLSVVAIVRGGRIERLLTWRSPDLMVTTERVLHAVTESGCSRIAVDVGGVGAGVADRLKQLGYEVLAVPFGGGARQPERFLNRKAEMHWLVREAMEQGTIALPDDDELRADLSALRYAFNQAGKIVIEPKDECRKRLGRSPDRSDALCLAWLAAKGGAGSAANAVGVRREAVEAGPMSPGAMRPWTRRSLAYEDVSDWMRPRGPRGGEG